MGICPLKYMKNKNLGNIKIVSLLFVLGVASFSLAIPAIIKKEELQKEIGNVRGESDREDSLIKKAENIKKDYIDTPINKVSETTKNVSYYIQNPSKIIYSENSTPKSNPNSNLLSQNSTTTEPNSSILGASSKDKTSPSYAVNVNNPEPVIKITKQMVDNCKIITDEYNKVVK